jgi:hypothetical protein
MNIKETRKHMLTSILIFIFSILLGLIGIHLIWRDGSVDEEKPPKAKQATMGNPKGPDLGTRGTRESQRELPQGQGSFGIQEGNV